MLDDKRVAWQCLAAIIRLWSLAGRTLPAETVRSVVDEKSFAERMLAGRWYTVRITDRHQPQP